MVSLKAFTARDLPEFMPSFRTVSSFALAILILAMTVPISRAEPAPKWNLQDLSGKSVKLSDYKGKIVILDFWATWCPPCRAEIPHFIELQAEYGKRGLVVIGVSMDEDGVRSVASFAKRNDIDYPIVMGNQEVADKYGGVEFLPTTFVIDPKCNIVGKHQCLTDKSVFERAIKKLLPEVSSAK